MQYCGHCGVQTNENDKYCRSCGKPISGDTSSIATPHRSQKRFRIVLIAAPILLLVIVLLLSQTIFKASHANKSPEAVVYNYFKALRTNDVALFTKCVEGRGMGSAQKEMINGSKMTFLGSKTPKEEFIEQMASANQLFSIQHGDTWFELLQINKAESGSDQGSVNVGISINGRETSVPVIRDGFKGWFLTSYDYKALLPEITTLLDDTPQAANPNSEQDDNKATDYAATLKKGMVDGLSFGIGSDIRDIVNKWGEPAKTGYYDGVSLYMEYPKEKVLYLHNDTDNVVTGMVFLNGYKVFGVTIGEEDSQLQSKLGNPTHKGSVSAANELALSDDKNYYEYISGDCNLLFFSDGRKITQAYILKRPELSQNKQSRQDSADKESVEPNKANSLLKDVKPGERTFTD